MQYQMPMQQPQMQFVQQQPQMQFIQQAPPPPQYQIMSAPGPIMGMGGLPMGPPIVRDVVPAPQEQARQENVGRFSYRQLTRGTKRSFKLAHQP